MTVVNLSAFDGRWPQTAAAISALEFAVEHEPTWLLNHSLRSYLYARSIGASEGLVAGDDYDDEVLFIATVLHDIGLTDIGAGDERFEVAGADRAATLAREQGLSEASLELIWDTVALHTSAGIAARKRPEIALAHHGISADIFGFGVDKVDDAMLETAQTAFPWLDLRNSLITEVARRVHENPARWVPMSFVSAATRRTYPNASFPELDDLCRA